MNLRVSGKNIDLGESLRNRVTARIEEAVDKYFGGGWSGHVTVAPEGPGYRSDCTLHLDSGIVLQAQGEALDPILCCDDAVERIEKRLRRYKRRLKERRTDSKNTEPGAPPMFTDYVLSAPSDEAAEEEGWSPTVIAETESSLMEMTVSDAVFHLDLTGSAAFAFRNAAHGRVNMVYRRADGHIGWVDPAGAGDGNSGKSGD